MWMEYRSPVFGTNRPLPWSIPCTMWFVSGFAVKLCLYKIFFGWGEPSDSLRSWTSMMTVMGMSLREQFTWPRHKVLLWWVHVILLQQFDMKCYFVLLELWCALQLNNPMRFWHRNSLLPGTVPCILCPMHSLCHAFSVSYILCIMHSLCHVYSGFIF